MIEMGTSVLYVNNIELNLLYTKCFSLQKQKRLIIIVIEKRKGKADVFDFCNNKSYVIL